MNTLIVHPNDETTDFLKVVYQKIPNKTVITGGISYLDLNKLVESHDSVILMGHGSPDGLLSAGQFNCDDCYIIDHRMVEMLRMKRRCLFIWCNADWFVERNDLKGFYSGMFISEVMEAEACGVPAATQEMVDESNNEFCSIISHVIQEDTKTIYLRVRDKYRFIGNRNPVAFYNWQRLYVR